MKRVQFSILRTLALSAFIFTASCASDGPESVEEVEDENRIHERADDSSGEAELPNAEQAAADAQAATGEEGTVDSNWTGEVQQLPSDQQIAADENAVGDETPDQFQMKQTAAVPETIPADATAGAETDAESNPGLDSVLTSVAEGDAAAANEASPETSPSLPPEAEPTPADAIPTLADVVNDSEATQAADTVKKETNQKKSKAKKERVAKKSKKSKKGESASASITPSGDGKVYVVRPGDTLGRISKLLYGTSRRWKELAEKNNLTASAYIFPGDSITYTPDAKSAAFEAKWEGLNKASVSVNRGESLSKVAARVMGSGHYWKMLWQWNQESITDPNKIAVGQEIKYVAVADLNAALSAGKEGSASH